MKRLLIVSVLAGLSACTVSQTVPDSYSAGPTWGTVVDRDTQQPIKGALVIALWELEGGRGIEGGRSGNFKVAEALTNERGEFHMEGWGPLPIPTNGLLDKYDPLVYVFKAGYVPAAHMNDKFAARYSRVERQVRDSAYNGKVTALERYEGPPENYALIVGSLAANLSNVITNCGWKAIPKTVRTLDDEAQREKKEGVVPMVGTSAKILLMQKQCEPTDQFLRAYLEAY